MSEAPRSLHVIGGKTLGGVERFCIRLVCALHRVGAPVAAVVIRNGEIERALPDYVPRYHAPMASLFDFYSQWRIKQAIRDFKPDVVQTYMNRAAALTRIPAGRAIPLVARPGGYYKARHYKRYDSIVVTTEDIRQYFISQGIAAQSSVVIPNFVDIPTRLEAAEVTARRAALGIGPQDIVILGLGRLHPNKGWGDLLTVFSGLLRDNPDERMWLVMVGDGPLSATLREQAASLGIAPHVLWMGWQKQPDPYYQLADMFVCASVHEPFGNVILEAWANRTLVVSTPAEGPRELIRNDINGVLAPAPGAAPLAATLQAALKLDGGHKAAMIEAGLDEVDRHFSEAAIVSAYLALYGRLRDQSTGSGAGRCSR